MYRLGYFKHSRYCASGFEGVTDWYQSLVTMSSTTSAVTYTSVYTDSKPGRAFWGALAPPSPDYIPGPEDPQTPPVPQDEDKRETMFVQAHDPDYVPEPIYPEYIPLEDEHEFPAEEQPLPPVDSPTAESPGYVTELNPEENPEEYEDEETEDGPVDYPIDGGDDGDDEDGDSSRDNANDKDEDDEDEEEEEEEHLALADSTIVVPIDEPIFPPEGTKPVIPPPTTDITIGARITIRPQASISLPLEAEVERLLAMTTPSPSPPISLSPPYAEERLARCMAPHAHSSPLLPSSGCPTQIQTLRIASTQALIDAVTAALPSPPLPPLPPSLYIPPPVDRRDDIPEFEQHPRKRIYIVEAENASLRARNKTTEAIEKITRNRERQAREKMERNDVPSYTQRIQELTLICTKLCASETEKVDKYVRGLPDNIYRNVKSSKTLDATIVLSNALMDQKLRTYVEKSDNKRKADDSSRNNHGHQQQPFKKRNVGYNVGVGEKKSYGVAL
ncbi:hypothetical protein Tco_1012060 [Tanacetum coccineum]